MKQFRGIAVAAVLALSSASWLAAAEAQQVAGQDAALKADAAQVAVEAKTGDGIVEFWIEAPESTTPNGLLAFVDPVTGELRTPSAEEMAALSASSSGQEGGQRRKRIRMTRHTEGALAGMLTAQLTEDFLNFSVATVNSDGTVSWGCVSGLDTANGFVQAGNPIPPVAPVLEEK